MGTAGWGLPLQLHVDEKGFVLWEAFGTEWRGLTQDDWRPRITNYGPVIFDLAIATKWMLYGGHETARPVAQQFKNDWDYLQGAFAHVDENEPYPWAKLVHAVRLLSGLLGTLSILLLARAAYRLSGPVVAALTACIAASAVGLIQVGHFFTPDALVIFELSLLLDACSGLLDSKTRSWRLAHVGYAGLAIGLLAATKMPAALAAAAVPVALLLSPARKAHAVGYLFVAGLAAALVFTAFCPWAVFNPSEYFATRGNRSGSHLLQTLYTERAFDFYDWRFVYNVEGEAAKLGSYTGATFITQLLPYALGSAALLASAYGIVAGLRSKQTRRAAWIAFATVLPAFLFVAGFAVTTLRYALPLVPGLCILAAIGAAHLWENRGTLGRIAATSIVAYTALYGTAFTLIFSKPDPRIEASQYILEHAAPNDVIVVEPEASYTVALGDNAEGIGRLAAQTKRLSIRRLWAGHPEATRVPAHITQTLRRARFVVVGDFYLDKADHPAAGRLAPEQKKFYDDLRAGRLGFKRVARFFHEPALGPFVWSEEHAESLATGFDHMGVEVYEKIDGAQR